MEDEIIVHRMRSYSDDFESDQVIRFERIAHIKTLGQIEERIEELQEQLTHFEEQRKLTLAAIENWEKQYGHVED